MREVEDIASTITQISSALGALLMRRKSQDEIRWKNEILAAAESMANMGSWEWDTNRNKVTWSKGVYEIYGYEDQEVVPSYELFMEKLYDEDRERVEKELAKAIERSEGYDVTYRVVHDDTIRFHRSVATPEYDYQGHLDRYYGTVIDITYQKEHELELLRKNSELRASNENLEQFAYVASHDLQEPLRKIRAFGDRLVTKYKQELDERGQDYISRMQGASERMQALINDLLKYSRVARSNTEFVRVNLNTLITGVMEDIEIRLKERNAKVTVDSMPDIDGEPTQLRQLFQNIIGNAVKFTPDDRIPEVKIQGSMVKGSYLEKQYDFSASPTKHFVKIDIIDNGIGFEQKYAERIFNLFERLHGRQEFRGTGIGLAVCQKVVQNHNGFIKALSEEGKGATFTIVLPINNKRSNG